MRLSEAADQLGVHYQTAYGWVRQRQLPARKVGRGYEISPADLEAFAARRRRGEPPPAQVRVRDWPARAARLHAALVSGDESGAAAQLAGPAGAVSLVDLCDQLISPALRQVGQDWAQGRLSIAVEHRATAICERLVAARAVQPRGRPRGTAVAAAPAGEHHGLPALMAAACLREDCWNVHHLAADVPVDQIAQFSAESGADLVVLSTVTAPARAAAAQATVLIRAGQPGTRVLIGQPGDTLRILLRRARNAAG